MNREVLNLFHHIHHKSERHEVHHCGGKHAKTDPEVDYIVKHCACGKHSINRKTAIGHATGKKLSAIEVIIEFAEKCPNGGWHVESGKTIKQVH